MKKTILAVLIIGLSILVASILVYLSSNGGSGQLSEPTESTAEETLIKNFIQENLKEEYQPESLEVKHKLTIKNQTNGTDDIYGAFWEISNAKFYSYIDYNPDSVGITHLGITIQPPDVPDKIDETAAVAIVKDYFKDIEDDLHCREVFNELAGQEFTICESFWQEENMAKRGIGVLGTFVFACEIPPESEHYQWQSCTQW